MKNSKGIWFFLIVTCMQNEFSFGDSERKQGLASQCVSIGRDFCCNSKWIMYFAGDGSGWCSNPEQKRAKVAWTCRPVGAIGAIVGSTSGSVAMGPKYQKYPIRDSNGQHCKIIAVHWINPNEEL